MVYKKYVKKRGKVFGPYYYESYRVGKDVKKIYIGGKKEYKAWLEKKAPKKKTFFSNFTLKHSTNKLDKRLVEQPFKKRKVGLKNFSMVLIAILVIVCLAFLLHNQNVETSESSVSKTSFSKVIDSIQKPISGFVSSELFGEEEKITQDFDKRVDLKIKDPPKSAGKAISKNKNKRMDFELPSGNARLYFDLLNYSEFVEMAGEVMVEEGLVEVVSDVGNDVNETTENVSEGAENVSEEVLDESNGVGNVSETGGISDGLEVEEINPGITGFFSRIFNIGVTGKVVKDKGKNKKVEVEVVKEKIGELGEEKIDEISEGSVIELKNKEFEVVIDEIGAEEKEVDYKWGYEVELKDLDFMAKVEVTSEENISVWDDSTLRIGDNLISFSDLVEEGYNVRFDVPSLDVKVEEVVELVEENASLGEEINVTISNMTEENVSISNETEIIGNVTDEIVGNESQVNVTIGNVTYGEMIIVNETEIISNVTEENVSVGNESVVEDVEDVNK